MKQFVFPKRQKFIFSFSHTLGQEIVVRHPTDGRVDIRARSEVPTSRLDMLCGATLRRRDWTRNGHFPRHFPTPPTTSSAATQVYVSVRA